jgi:hypothetical protein
VEGLAKSSDNALSLLQGSLALGLLVLIAGLVLMFAGLP